jgi:hypothetical protein
VSSRFSPRFQDPARCSRQLIAHHQARFSGWKFQCSQTFVHRSRGGRFASLDKVKKLPPGGSRAVKHSAVLLLTATAVVIGIGALGFATSASMKPASDSRPNILVIMTDDQGHDTLTSQFMPFTKAMIADQGVTFTRGYISTAICCPSRASFLTGKYARHHGVHNNPDELKDPTFAEALKQAGYFTGMIGKYLNSWPGDARKEYDFWICWLHGYNNPTMNVFGTEQSVSGYVTYIMRDYAVEFLEQVPQDKPFFL